MKYFLFVFVPFLLIGCSDNTKRERTKYQKFEIDSKDLEITPKKIKHSMKQTMDIIDPFASGLVEFQQVGDNALRRVAKDRRDSRKNSHREKK